MNFLRNGLIPLLGLWLAIGTGCEKKVTLNQYAHLLNQNSLLIENKYAVVRPPFIRVKETPQATAKGLFTLQRNDVISVSLKVSQVGGWCEINSDPVKGWIPVDELLLFDSFSEAREYQMKANRVAETPAF